MSRPVFKTGLAAIAVAGEFDSLPPPPYIPIMFEIAREGSQTTPVNDSLRIGRLYSKPWHLVLGLAACIVVSCAIFGVAFAIAETGNLVVIAAPTPSVRSAPDTRWNRATGRSRTNKLV